jgi:hypothetical protein
VAVQLKGTVACFVSPGLANVASGGLIDVSCKTNSVSDPVVNHCEGLCEVFGKTVGLEESLNGGKTFEDAWWLLTLEGSLNKDVFMDD